MKKLIQLLDGQWVDPNRVVSVEVGPSEVFVTTRDRSVISVRPTPRGVPATIKELEQWRDHVANQVNQSRD